jgi:hypothetical protein
VDTSVGVAGDTQADEGTTDDIELKFIRQSSDITAALTVSFNVVWSDPLSDADHPANNLSDVDFVADAGRATLISGSVVIPAGQTEVTVTLDAAADASFEGIESAFVQVLETSDYAVVRSTVDPKDPGYKKKAKDIFSWTPIQVVDDVTLFADGVPSNADGAPVHYNDVKQGSVGNCFFHAALALTV